MIAVEDRIVAADAIPIFEESLKASAERVKGDRPAKVVLMFNGGETIEPDFAGLRFDEESNQLMPLVEVGRWGNLVLVLGLRKWLIFKASPMVLTSGIELHRDTNDDTGFYRVDFHECEGLLIAIYEGGVMAITDTGEVVWHRKKHWDDELLEIQNGRVMLLAETGERFAFDCRNGTDVSME